MPFFIEGCCPVNIPREKKNIFLTYLRKYGGKYPRLPHGEGNLGSVTRRRVRFVLEFYSLLSQRTLIMLLLSFIQLVTKCTEIFSK